MSTSTLKSIGRNLSSTEDALCIIKSSDFQGIRTCAFFGIAVLTPNPFMQPELIMKTILKMNKRLIIISADIFKMLKSSLEDLHAKKLGLQIIPFGA